MELILTLLLCFTSKPDLYPTVPILTLAKKDAWVRPRATIEGVVVYVNREADGDIHVTVQEVTGKAFVVCEIIPELLMSNGHPKKGDLIRVWGICRWDGKHGWGELHPVIGWRTISKMEK